MRCQTCGHTAHPGYIAWRGVDGAGIAAPGRPFFGAPIPCPDCGGTVVTSGCEGFRPTDGAITRPYRYYLLDGRGMIHYAEIVDAECDDDAKQHAQTLLAGNAASSAIEVWDRRRAVHVTRRSAPTGEARPG